MSPLIGVEVFRLNRARACASTSQPLLSSANSFACLCFLRCYRRARKAAAALPGLLTPRLPFAALLGLPSLPSPPPPPVFLPGLGLLPLPEAVERLAPPLSDQEVIYYQSLLELVAGACCWCYLVATCLLQMCMLM